LHNNIGVSSLAGNQQELLPIELEVNNDNTTIGISHVDPLPVHDVSVSIPVNNIKPTTTTTTATL
jgi:hypothetical protein